jgi:hypothetical protein
MGLGLSKSWMDGRKKEEIEEEPSIFDLYIIKVKKEEKKKPSLWDLIKQYYKD